MSELTWADVEKWEDYLIIESASSADLMEKINVLLKIGYKPLGGVSVGLSGTGKNIYITYVQAVIRDERK